MGLIQPKRKKGLVVVLASLMAGLLALPLFVASPAAADHITEARDFQNACANAPEADVPDREQVGAHTAAIDCVMAYGFFLGNTDGSFGSDDPMLRMQMATVIMRKIDTTTDPPEASTADQFPNDNCGVHDPFVNRAADLQIALGFKDGKFRCTFTVTRGQMASFIVREMRAAGATLPECPPASAAPSFSDIADSAHRCDIEILHEMGIALGFGDGSFRPNQPIIRAEMASFIARNAGELVEQGLMLPIGAGTNQDFTVTPDSPALNTVSTVAGTNVDRGRREYSVTVPAGTVVDIALIPVPNVMAEANGPIRFADSAPVDNRADGLGATGAKIELVNGVANAGEYANNVTPGSGGVITFVVDSENANVAIIPVVFVDRDPNNQLNLNPGACQGFAPNRFCEPTEDDPATTTIVEGEPFGVGGAKLFVPAEAADQTSVTHETIIALQIADLFTHFNNTFRYESTDTFRYASGTATNIAITMADFERDLSGRGAVNVAGLTFRTGTAQVPGGGADPANAQGAPGGPQRVRGDVTFADYNTTGPSQFTIVDDTPAAPTAVAAAALDVDVDGAADDIQVTWTAPPNRDVAGYEIWRAPINEAGVVGAFVLAGTTTGKAATTFNDFNRPPGRYAYVVLAFNAQSGALSANSNTADITMPSASVARTPASNTITLQQGTVIGGGGLNVNNQNAIDQGDTITINLSNGPITLSNPAVALRNGDGTRVVLNSSNATFTVGGTNNTVLTINVTATPAPVGSTGGNNLMDTNLPIAVDQDGTTGIANAAGNWNLPASGCVVGDVTGGCTAQSHGNTRARVIESVTAAGGGITDVFSNEVDLPENVPVNSITVNPGNDTVTIAQHCATPGAPANCTPTTTVQNGDPFAIFDVNGVQKATGTFNNLAGNTVTIAGTEPGQILYFVYTDVSMSRLPSETTQLFNPGLNPVVINVRGGAGNNQILVDWDRLVNQIGSPENYRVFNAANNTEVARGVTTVPAPGSGTGTTTVTVNLNNALVANTNYVLRVLVDTVESSANNVRNLEQQVPFTFVPFVQAAGPPFMTDAFVMGNTIRTTWNETVNCRPGNAATAGAFALDDQSAANKDQNATSIANGPAGNGTQCDLGFADLDPETFGNLTYTQPVVAGDRIVDTQGEAAGSETEAADDVTPPVLTGASAEAGGSTVLVTLSEPVRCGDLAPTDFQVSVAGANRTVTGATCVNSITGGGGSGQVSTLVRLTLQAPVLVAGQTVDVTAPAGGFRDQSGLANANSTASTTTVASDPPVFTSATGTAGTSTLTVQYDEPLDCATVDADGSDYEVNQVTPAAAPVAITAATCSGSTVTLTRTGTFTAGDTGTVDKADAEIVTDTVGTEQPDADQIGYTVP